MSASIDEALLKRRVAGTSGLGLAEEQRVRRSVSNILNQTLERSALAHSCEQDVEFLEIQAIRLGIASIRREVDRKYIEKDILRSREQLQRIRNEIVTLQADVGAWKNRNAVYGEFETAVENALRAGPPTDDLYAAIDAVDCEIAVLNEQIEEEVERLRKDVNSLTSLLDSIKSF